MTTVPDPPRQRPRPTFYPVMVVETRDLTPRLRRVVFAGDTLDTYTNDGPSTHCKLALSPDSAVDVAPPTVTPDGVQWPEDCPRPVLRTYTPRLVDQAAKRLAIDFALHPAGGPATRWAAAARPGQQLVVSGGRGAYRIDPAAPWTVVAADETSLPAVGTILEAAPQGARVLLLGEVADSAEELEFDTPASLQVTWLHRGEAPQRAGRLAAQAIRESPLPEGDGNFWICLEATAMREARQYLLHERGVGRDRLYTRGYWKLGEVDHPDHDSGDEV
jgi:NADPH-dependent ferric siderophore reductase